MSKKVAAEKLDISQTSLSKIEPSAKPRIIWDSKLTGFGVKVMPSGTMTFIVNYRTDGGGRKASNKRMSIGRYGKIAPAQARKKAKEILGAAEGGTDPSGERQKLRNTITLKKAFENYMESNPNRKPRTNELYRYEMDRYLGDWFSKPINQLTRLDIQNRFNLVTEKHGPSPANRVISLLRSVYKAPCAENESLRNPVEVWLTGGGRLNPKKRRKIDTPVEILPKWKKGIDTIQNDIIRDAIHMGLYTGMRLREILSLKWSNITERELVVEETKSGIELRLPITTQLANVLKRRKKDNKTPWVFPNPDSKSGHFDDIHHVYPTITKVAETRFWFHGLRNNFITIGERNLALSSSLIKRLVNHARPKDVTEGYAADWSMQQLETGAQAIANEIDRILDRAS